MIIFIFMMDVIFEFLHPHLRYSILMVVPLNELAICKILCSFGFIRIALDAFSLFICIFHR